MTYTEFCNWLDERRYNLSAHFDDSERIRISELCDAIKLKVGTYVFPTRQRCTCARCKCHKP